MERIGRKCRELMVEQLVKHLEASPNTIVTNYKGLKVKEIEELKDVLRQISARYIIVKNSLIKRAFERLNLKQGIDLTQGAVAIGFGAEDAVGMAKSLVNFKKKYSPFVICGGFLDRKFVSADLILEMAALPAREVLLAKFVGGLKSPINGFVGGLSGILRKLVCVIDAIKTKSSESE